jgi:D-alanyl-D-alanine carboxypeptidase
VHSPQDHPDFDERAALIAVLARHPRLSFAPGSRYGYSNIGYWLLGELVARVSGMAFTAYLQSRVLEPLGIAPEELGYRIVDAQRHAQGYLEKYSLMNLLKPLLVDRAFVGRYRGRWLEIRPHYLNGAAFGGLVGNVRGIAKFLQDQLRPHSVLFGDSMRRRFFEQQHTQSARALPTTPGWQVGRRRGAPYYYKEGGGGGFRCMMRLYLEQGIGTVVMTNATGFDVGGVEMTA